MSEKKIIKIIKILRKDVKRFEKPLISKIKKGNNKNAYKILISCLLSLRTRDENAYKASMALFSIARTPEEMIRLKNEEIEKAIKNVNYYKTKAKRIREISMELISKYKGKVPNTREELLKLKGIGRKTANIVLSYAFKKDAIAVDTHVHRISNRLGIIKTKNSKDTEFALMRIVPKRYWRDINELLVTWGQNVCLPRNPKCEECSIRKYCKKIGVR